MENYIIVGVVLLLVDVYKRQVVGERIRMAMGGDKENPNVIEAVSYTHLDVYKRQHIPCTEYANGRLLYNPGSVGEPRGGKPTFGILLVTRDGIFPRTAVLQPPAPEKDFL